MGVSADRDSHVEMKWANSGSLISPRAQSGFSSVFGRDEGKAARGTDC